MLWKSKAKKLKALTNKDHDHKDNYKEIFTQLAQEIFDKIIE